MRAIEHATRVNNWLANLSQDEVPPSWMWPFEDELSTWFETVEANRKEKYGGGDTEGPMTRNEWRPGDE